MTADRLSRLIPRHMQQVEFEPFRIEISLLGDDLSLDASVVELESFFDRMEVFWPVLMKRLEKESILDELGLSPANQIWDVDLNLVSDATIQEINRTYRQKDEPTDVLSFPQVADSEIQAQVVRLPSIQLGSLFLSVDWAKAHQSEVTEVSQLDRFTYYLLERFIHGLLHLMGAHHDTMEDYSRVVNIQKDVLAVLFGLLPEGIDEETATP